MSNGYIDVHHHIIPKEYKDNLIKFGIEKSGGLPIRDWSVDMSLSHMDELGVDKAYVSLSEPCLYPIVEKDIKAGRDIARSLNIYMKELKDKYPDKFGAFAVLPLPDVEGAIEEAKYALDVLNLDGVGLLSNYRQEFLGNEIFDELFNELDKRNAVIYIHPSIPVSEDLFKRPQFVPYDYFEEFCFNTNRAATNLILSGTLERYQNIKPILSHMGGTLPFLFYRLNTCYNNAIKRESENLLLPEYVFNEWNSLSKPLHDYFGRFYYDCALSSNEIAFKAVETVAPNHILFGSDAFYATMDSAKSFVRGVEDYYKDDRLKKIKYDNALKLFSKN